MDQENLDLLDLGEENEEVDTLPEATPFQHHVQKDRGY